MFLSAMLDNSVDILDFYFIGLSSSHTQCFNLIRCDLLTSLVVSVSGYKYYLIIFDDFSHYS
jgi:hypothetical protein